MNSNDFFNLLGSTAGPGWVLAAWAGVQLWKVSRRLGQLETVLIAVRSCPRANCPVKSSFPVANGDPTQH